MEGFDIKDFSKFSLCFGDLGILYMVYIIIKQFLKALPENGKLSEANELNCILILWHNHTVSNYFM